MNCFLLLLTLWLTRAPSGAGSGWSQLFKVGFPSDASAALFVAFLLFILPAEKPFQRDENGKFIISKPLITWKQMSSKMSWGVIFLLGGGFAMASGITSSGNYSQLSLHRLNTCVFVGLGKFVGLKMQALKGLPSYLMVLICCVTINLMSQVTSNSSTMTIFASILCDMAENLNINPMFILIPSTAAVSFAFSLPVSTPPNAVVFEYGSIIRSSVNINSIFRIRVNAGHGQSRSPAVSYRRFLVFNSYSYFWRTAIHF
jgi:sodium-dependent dicarboxylate transporter 2/3/5